MKGITPKEIEPGKWRLRWREYPEVDGVRREVTRSETVHDERTAERLAVEIRGAVETTGTWKPAVQVVRTPCNLEVQFTRWQEAHRAQGLAKGTLKTATSAATRFFAVVRDVLHIGPAEAIPGSALSQRNFRAVLLRMIEQGVAEGRRYDILRYALDFWTWLSDEEESERIGVEPAPRDKGRVLPRKPARGDPPRAPRIDEIDATLREARTRHTRDLADVLATCRYTGLRSGQVLAIRVEDLELAQPSEARLFVSTGKTAKEKKGRWVPISAHLAALLAPYVEGKEPTELIFKRGHARTPYIPSVTLHSILMACEERGEIAPEVWRPRGRGNKRTTHLNRAALQAFLEAPPDGAAAVSSKAIDALVGQASPGQTVRALHYSPALWAEMRRAVDLLPPVDWTGPGRAVDNVVRLHPPG